MSVPSDWYRAAFESSINGAALHEVLVDDAGKPFDYVFVEVNRAFERILELDRDDLIGRRVTEVFPGIEKEPWIATYGEVARSGDPVFFEQHSAALGKDFEVYAFCPAPGHFIALFHDITPLVAARSALERSEAMRRSVLESSADHIMLVDLDGTIRYINRTVEGLTVAEVLGTDVRSYLDPRWHEGLDRCFARVIETGSPDRYEVEYDYDDGRIGFFETRVSPVLQDGVVTALTLSASDRTEYRALEERLRQAQKMEAIGRLAGGVAHDFNNLLTGIKGFTHMALTRAEAEPQMADDLEQVNALVDQASDLTQQLLAFSRRQAVDLRVLNLNQVIEESVEMLGRLLGEPFTLEVDTDADLDNVRADRGQMQQIIMNLAVNARDAMPDGGRILIQTRNLDPDEGEDTGQVCLRVIDDGPGIDPDVLPYIFEPFYTTKEVGRGTGLGLATVYGIVRQHGGDLTVRSEPGEGACFEVCLPPVAEAVEEPAEAPERREGGDETVMVVEDEEAVREVASRVLRSRGYRVIEAADPPAALRLFASRRVDLLVTDVVMPGGDGPSLYLALLRRDPDLKVIYMSGYAEPAGIEDISALGAPFLRKPFSPDMLVAAVRDCLDS